MAKVSFTFYVFVSFLINTGLEGETRKNCRTLTGNIQFNLTIRSSGLYKSFSHCDRKLSGYFGGMQNILLRNSCFEEDVKLERERECVSSHFL